MIRYGSRGEEVRKLQARLKELGYIISVDGIFGKGTLASVKAFQEENGLVVDGVVGVITQTALLTASPTGFQIIKKNPYITIIKIPIQSIEKLDLIDSVGTKETVMAMQKRTGANLMINGILYGMINGKEIVRFIDDGKLIAPGIFSSFSLMIYKDGSFRFGEFQYSQDLKDCFGAAPSLVRNGEIYIDAKGFEKDQQFLTYRHPRVAIGTDYNNFYIVIVDGRRVILGMLGMTIKQLANLCKEIGCKDAMNLDGGGSAIAILDGKKINNPLENRAVANGLGIWFK